ncbi:hypothetical protein ILYODFUR_024952 [Ilyodon furcidens]|uniref:Uncharacterized protein n=1 Tax=Ilyodon furcidens TaxID=33524 RepID=A0ABV0UMV7_9TELE
MAAVRLRVKEDPEMKLSGSVQEREGSHGALPAREHLTTSIFSPTLFLGDPKMFPGQKGYLIPVGSEVFSRLNLSRRHPDQMKHLS